MTTMTIGGTLAWSAGGPCTSGCLWEIGVDGGVRLLWGQNVVADMPALRTQAADDVRVAVSLAAPNTARQAILAAGWPLPYATQAEQQAAHDAMWARVEADLHAEREARSGGQRNDPTPCEQQPIAPTSAQIRAQVDGRAIVAVRLKSVGYGALTDSDIEAVLLEQGAQTYYAADALSGEAFVGSVTGGAVTEICYDLDGHRWYMYVLTHSMGDTWMQAWWVSGLRYTAQAAADIIEAAAKLAWPRTGTMPADL